MSYLYSENGAIQVQYVNIQSLSGVYSIISTYSINSNSGINVQNTSTGTSAGCSIFLRNDTGNSARFGLMGSAHSTLANKGVLAVNDGIYQLYINAARVGINVTSPNYTLEVGTASGSGSLGVAGATVLSSTLSVSGATTLLSTLAINGVATIGDATSDDHTVNGTMLVSSGSNVLYSLRVLSSINTDQGISVTNSNSGTSTVSAVNLFSNTDQKFSVGINGSNHPTAANNGFIWHYHNFNVRIGTNNVERVLISSAGRIGINNSGPNYSLEISTASGDVPSGALGVNGKVVTTAEIVVGTFLECTEMAEPAAPAANKGRIFMKDTGGKTQLLVRFPSGASQVIATEP